MIARLAALLVSLGAHAGVVWLGMPPPDLTKDVPAIRGAQGVEVTSVDPATLAPPPPPPPPPPPAAPVPPKPAPQAAVPKPVPPKPEAPAKPPPEPAAQPPAPPPAVSGGPSPAATQEGMSEQDRAALTAWQRKVALALAAAKTYPEAARRARREGEVVVVFTVAADGAVTSRRIRQSSGHAELDAAALAVLDGLSRLPAPPAAAGRTTLAVPFAYRVKG